MSPPRVSRRENQRRTGPLERYIEYLNSGVLLQPVHAELDAYPGAFDPAERCHGVQHAVLIDPGRAAFEPPRRLSRATSVISPYGSAETRPRARWRVRCLLHGLILRTGMAGPNCSSLHQASCHRSHRQRPSRIEEPRPLGRSPPVTIRAPRCVHRPRMRSLFELHAVGDGSDEVFGVQAVPIGILAHNQRNAFTSSSY